MHHYGGKTFRRKTMHENIIKHSFVRIAGGTMNAWEFLPPFPQKKFLPKNESTQI